MKIIRHSAHQECIALQKIAKTSWKMRFSRSVPAHAQALHGELPRA